MKANKPQ